MPPLYVSPAAAVGNETAVYFAEAAALERASVDASRILAKELRHHGAPRRLVRAAARAARDEMRHARTTGALARRFGTHPAQSAAPRPVMRPLEDMAVENAVEGCVSETYGALIATYQGKHAQDPVVRAAMQRIGRDETRHAALAWRSQRG